MNQSSPKFTSRAYRLLSTSSPDLSPLAFSDLVLLNQLCNAHEIQPPLADHLSADQLALVRQLSYRHDQLEHKANCQDYKQHHGADVVFDFVQAIKHATYMSADSVDIQRYNPARQGYMQLLDLKVEGVKKTIMVMNRQDWMNDGETVNGYEKIRRM